MKIVLFLSFLLCLVGGAIGYCYIHPFQDTKCAAPNGVTIPVGSELVIPEKCERCSCSVSAGDPGQSILSCCGYGKNGGVIAPRPGCTIVTGEDGCSVKMVHIDNETLPCSFG